MTNSIKEVYLKNLASLQAELAAYMNEAQLWETAPGINNCGGNLFLHLIGNLNYFIGAELGNTGYIRNRDAEFSDKNIPRQKIADDLAGLVAMIDTVLSGISEMQLSQPYPTDKFGAGKSIHYVLTYLLAHLNYHLGQINYHRRLLNH